MSKDVKYKLYYFNARGRAEVIRLALAYAGVEYEDIRFKDRDDWINNYKHLSPTGQSPFFEADGKKIGQSMAIARYVARGHKLYGKDNWDGALIDQILDTLEDMTKPLIDWRFEQDEAKKEEKKKKLDEETIPAFMQLLDKLLKNNDGGKGFFVGDGLSIADIAVFNTCAGRGALFPKCMDKCTALPAFIDRRRRSFKIHTILFLTSYMSIALYYAEESSERFKNVA